MKRKKSEVRLQTLLAAVENGLLGARDKDLRAEASFYGKEAKALIRTKLSDAKRASKATLPDDAEQRRQLLASIIANQQMARPGMRLAYTSKRKVSDLEVSALLRKFLASGTVGKKKGEK